MELVSKSQSLYILRLDAGEELRGEVERFCKEQSIFAGWINALGSSKELELAYYNLARREYETKGFPEELEITAIIGNVALKDNNPFLHIHGTFGNSEISVIGGHINRCVVFATCEVSIWKAEKGLERKFDESTGLHLLCE